MNIRSTFYTPVLLLLWCFSLQSKALLLGDLATADADNNGFSFNLLNKLGKNRTQEYIYVASAVDLAAQTTEIKNYALSAASASGTKCGSLAPEKATVNGTADQTNPLHGAQFTNIGMADTCPVLMKQGDATKIYVVTSSPLSSSSIILTNDGVLDFQEQAGSFITEAEATGTQDTIQGVGPIIIAAVKPNGGDFGEAQGGIALFRKTSSGLIQQKAITGDDAIKAVPVQLSSTFLKINTDLASLEANKVNLYWDNRLFRLFIGVQATANNGANDGCFSTTIGYIQDNGINATLTFYNIAPAAAITGETKIIGTQGANLAAYVYKQTVMYTSTGLSYLITVGESDDPANNDNMQKGCYALPLVDESVNPAKASTWTTSTTHATLAKKGSIPTTFYRRNRNDKEVISGRGFQTPAAVAADLYDRTDREVLVGGASISGLTAGLILDVEAYNDTVFVLVGGGANLRGGVFYSQAIFDENGAIKNWTAWQRATITLDEIKDFAYMPSQGATFHLEAGNVNTRGVTLSNWTKTSKDNLLGGTLTDETVGFTALLSTEFPSEKGGVFGLFDFPSTFGTTFFSQAVAPGTAMMIATGYQKIGLFLTQAPVNVGDFPIQGDFKNNTLRFTEGAIDPEIVAPFTNVAAFISGGDLDDLEAITSATILTDINNDKRYIVVGGTGGVAVLRHTLTQEGFQNPLNTGFEGFGADLAFDTIGDFTNVRKLWTAVIGDDQYLFVLTITGLYRIEANELRDANPTIITLATLSDLGLSSYDFCTDVIVSNKLCLLGTNKGLMRNGNGTNICTAANATQCDWTSLELPEPHTNVAQLLPLHTTSLNYQFATNNIGQVYVLAHSDSFTSSVLHRLKISDISAAAIDNNTCTLLTRETVKNITAPFMTLGSLRNNVTTNGALTLTTSLTQPTQRSQMFSIPVNTNTLIRTTENYPFTELKLSLDNNKQTIRGFTYNSALGALIAYGNFGIQVCE